MWSLLGRAVVVYGVVFGFEMILVAATSPAIRPTSQIIAGLVCVILVIVTAKHKGGPWDMGW